MKYLKLYEQNMLDTILDKINNGGMGSLTSLEKDFLDKYSRGEHQEVEKEIQNKKNTYKGILNYDHRKDDTDFYQETGKAFAIDDMSFKNWSDKDIEDGKYQQLWDKLYDEDMDSFLRQYKLPDSVNDISWDKLPPQIQKYFKTYIKDIGMLD